MHVLGKIWLKWTRASPHVTYLKLLKKHYSIWDSCILMGRWWFACGAEYIGNSKVTAWDHWCRGLVARRRPCVFRHWWVCIYCWSSEGAYQVQSLSGACYSQQTHSYACFDIRRCCTWYCDSIFWGHDQDLGAVYFPFGSDFSLNIFNRWSLQSWSPFF